LTNRAGIRFDRRVRQGNGQPSGCCLQMQPVSRTQVPWPHARFAARNHGLIATASQGQALLIVPSRLESKWLNARKEAAGICRYFKVA
jgi:hypothetical protein